jgi:hypothetical protein
LAIDHGLQETLYNSLAQSGAANLALSYFPDLRELIENEPSPLNLTDMDLTWQLAETIELAETAGIVLERTR